MLGERREEVRSDLGQHREGLLASLGTPRLHPEPGGLCGRETVIPPGAAVRGIMRIILRDVKVTAGPLEINSRQLTWQSQRAQREQEAGQRTERKVEYFSQRPRPA